MVKFKTILTEEKALPLQNRVVECVTKFRVKHPLYGIATTWRGAVESEYFTIMFVQGFVLVSLVERECHLGQNSVHYATSKIIVDRLMDLPDDEQTKLNVQSEYNKNDSQREQDSVTFNEILEVLNWKYKEFAKIDEDWLGD